MNDSIEATEKWSEFTVSQLNDWGVKYHKIFFGKPAGDVYVDDKGQNDIEFFSNFPTKTHQCAFISAVNFYFVRYV